jgi:hypothetical protein
MCTCACNYTEADPSSLTLPSIEEMLARHIDVSEFPKLSRLWDLYGVDALEAYRTAINSRIDAILVQEASGCYPSCPVASGGISCITLPL